MLCLTSFLDYCRLYKYDKGAPRRYADRSSIVAIGVRYGSEMKDLYLGQLAVMNMPHYARRQLQPDEDTDFNYFRCLLGFLSYLASLHFGDDGTVRIGSGGHYAAASSFLCGLPDVPVGPIFASRLRALEYIEELARLDMQYRSISTDRQQTALQRIRASYYLACGVCAPADRALWNAVPSGSIK